MFLERGHDIIILFHMIITSVIQHQCFLIICYSVTLIFDWVTWWGLHISVQISHISLKNILTIQKVSTLLQCRLDKFSYLRVDFVSLETGPALIWWFIFLISCVCIVSVYFLRVHCSNVKLFLHGYVWILSAPDSIERYSIDSIFLLFCISNFLKSHRIRRCSCDTFS